MRQKLNEVLPLVAVLIGILLFFPLGAVLMNKLPLVPLGALPSVAVPMGVLPFGTVPLGILPFGNSWHEISIMVVPIYMASAGEVFR